MKALCAFALGVAVTQGINWASRSTLAIPVNLADLEQISARLELQGNPVGSCRNVELSITPLARRRVALVIEGQNWNDQKFAKAQVIRDQANGIDYGLAARRIGPWLWVYRVRTPEFPDNLVDYVAVAHPLYGIRTDEMGHITDLKTRSGRSLCGGFNRPAAVKALP